MNVPEEAGRVQALPIEDWNALTAMVMRMFDHWQVSAADRVGLLGLQVTDENALDRFRRGEMIGVDLDLKERVGLLLSIHSRLRLLFPEDRSLAYRWMSAPNRAFENLTPVAIVRKKGLVGLRAVRSYLGNAVGI
jgi:Protein of unknown function (DUF2384)